MHDLVVTVPPRDGKEGPDPRAIAVALFLGVLGLSVLSLVEPWRLWPWPVAIGLIALALLALDVPEFIRVGERLLREYGAGLRLYALAVAAAVIVGLIIRAWVGD